MVKVSKILLVSAVLSFANFVSAQSTPEAGAIDKPMPMPMPMPMPAASNHESAGTTANDTAVNGMEIPPAMDQGSVQPAAQTAPATGNVEPAPAQ